MAEANIIQSGRNAFRYTRNSFYEAGIDNSSAAPAQDPEMFETLENILASTQGQLDKRWGYSLFNNPGAPVWRRLLEAQSDANSIRRIVAIPAAAASVKTFTEAGATGLTLFTTTGAATRAVNSRDYVYFASGSSADSLKWAVHASTTTSTNWGIAAPESSATSVGPSDSGTQADDATVGTIAWANPANVATSNNVYSTAALGIGNTSHYLKVSNFGFTLPTTAVVLGIKVEIERKVNTDSALESVRVMKLGSPIGGGFGPFSFSDAADTYITYGGTTNLWGFTWTPAEINNSGFGFVYQVQDEGLAVTVSVDHIRCTIYYSVPITVANGGAGNITLVSGRKYTTVFYNSTTGHYSDLAPFSESTGPVTTDDIDLSTIPVSTDTQVDRKLILATADGGDETLLYEVADLANATTTYTDDLPEDELLIRNLYLEVDEFGTEFGVTGNLRPSATAQFPTKHRGRIYMADGQFVLFSKNIAELTMSTGNIAGRYEEAWPAENQLDISPGAETVEGLLSDGQVLYVATERRIYRIFGEGPEDFSRPEVLFNQVGLLNQDVWQVVFMEGNPVGAMWLTPDYRLIGSDFNTYQDIGDPIQTTLSSINDTHASKSWAVFYGDAQFDLYILAIPTGANTEPDTLCVYDMRTRRWTIWKPTDSSTAGLYNINATGQPQLIFGAGTGKLYKYDAAQTQDRVSDTPVSFTATIQTSWLSFDDPVTRKLLQELEIMTEDSAVAITVQGASTLAEFATPSAVITSTAPTTGPLGEYKLYLAGSTAKDRFYRFKFVSSAAIGTVVGGLNIEFVPLHRI